jgi:hypothetical protein
MIAALKAADIETPIYISVQWDERNARLHPEWRVMSASNSFQHALPGDPSSAKQLSPAWHTICLNHDAYRQELLEQAREVLNRYDPPGLFFDIILTPDCVCPRCIETMHKHGLDPANPRDRLKNDEAVNDRFRRDMSAALRAEFPGTRIFYNCGHIHKQGPKRFDAYSHLEIESLPTGGWGYDHFPSSARYAAFLGFDFMSHTGKFHTSWGEFGGFKHPHALEYEAAQMVALGAKCLVGDQLHPNGAINPDTYASIRPAYSRIEKLEPYLDGARQVSEVAIMSAEYFHPLGERNSVSDDGAVQMLLELKVPFDVIDPSARLADYRLVILPDSIPLDDDLEKRFAQYVAGDGKVIFTGRSAIDGERVRLPAGISIAGLTTAYYPTYLRASLALDAGMPQSPFVMYGVAQTVAAGGAEVLAEILSPYFNRTYAHFSSHQHAPDDPEAKPIGPGVTVHGNVAYIAYPIFDMYQAMGQPLYRNVVRGLLARLLPHPAFVTDLPTAGRATLTRQDEFKRHILHLLYGPPQVRGKRVPLGNGTYRVMEMIEDIPAIGPVSARVRLPKPPARVYDALTGSDIAWSPGDDGTVEVRVPQLHIHAALVFEGTT